MERPTGDDGVEGLGGSEVLECYGLKKVALRCVRIYCDDVVAGAGDRPGELAAAATYLENVRRRAWELGFHK
jgi:hypothetical protein